MLGMELFIVKKYLLYCLIAMTLLDTISFCQVMKLPLLLQHYQVHQELNPSMRMIDFLAMHYWGKDIDDQDEEQDQKLPFKTLQQVHPIVNVCTEMRIPYQQLDTYLLVESVCFEKTQLFTQGLEKSLFRPPQL